MPSLVKIRIERGRDLPVMDRNAAAHIATVDTSSSGTDAFVEVITQTYIQLAYTL